MLSLLAFFCILGLFLDTATEQLEHAKTANQEFFAQAEAEKCALIVDSVFLNTGTLPGAGGTNCFQQETGKVNSDKNSFIGSSNTLALAVSLNQKNSAPIIEVKYNEHYK